MGRRRYTPEQIITMLREAEVLQSQGTKMAYVCRKLGISAQTYCCWRKEYGIWSATRCTGCCWQKAR